MFVLPSLLSVSSLTTTLRLHLSRQLRPHCCFTSQTHKPNQTAPTITPFGAAHFRTASSERLRSAWHGSSRFGARDVWAKAFTTLTAPQEVQVSGENLQLQLKGKEVWIPLVWLRDHCRCQTCYNKDTFQKNVDKFSLKNLGVIQSDVDDDTLSVNWQDGHISKYSFQWIADNFNTPGFQPERFLWDGSRMSNELLPMTTFDLHMNTEDGLKNTLSNLIKYGFCIVNGAPASAEGMEMVSRRISFSMETVYGKVSVMVSGELAHADTAYTSLPLGAHIDTTYLTAPAGIQVFHCLQHDGEGGHTLLVDGFHAAEELRGSDPTSFDCLTRTVISHEFIEGSHYHLHSLGTVLSTDVMSGQLTQIRFNPCDRAPLRTVAAKDMAQFYRSYEALTEIIRSKESEFWIKLNPGMVLLVDNWRVMHGRSSFTGRRVLCGLYLPRDDWMSRARVLGLL